MDLDWCIVCDRHTNGGIYCSQECRNKDTPVDMQGKPPVVPGPLDVKKLAVSFQTRDLTFSSSTTTRNNANFSYLEDNEDDDYSSNYEAYKTLANDVFVSLGPLSNNNNNNNNNINRNNNNINNPKKRITSKFIYNNPSNLRVF